MVTKWLQSGYKWLQVVTRYFHYVQGLKGIRGARPKNPFRRVAIAEHYYSVYLSSVNLTKQKVI